MIGHETSAVEREVHEVQRPQMAVVVAIEHLRLFHALPCCAGNAVAAAVGEVAGAQRLKDRGGRHVGVDGLQLAHFAVRCVWPTREMDGSSRLGRSGEGGGGSGGWKAGRDGGEKESEPLLVSTGEI